MTGPSKSYIESIGVYLPAHTVTTDEVLEGCVNQIRFPLEDLTGIATRRMAGETEFAIDLAEKAVADCLANSRNTPEDVDLVICAHIARFDGPNRVTYEPCSAVRLKKRFGFHNALVFDVSNACAGMFSAIYVVDALIKAGAIRCGMVVSGEYITHLTKTAQKEIDGFMDPRLACLTLGDAGAAIMMQESPSDNVGFHLIDMYTLGKYSPLCIAGPSTHEHGGAAMVTDSIRATAAVVEHGTRHAAHALSMSPLPLEEFRHVIPHQTSKTSISEGLSEVAQLFGKNLQGIVVNNIKHRGNTASNSHFVAVKDQILSNTIKSGDSVMFCFSGSGITIGTALYTFDDLPDRVRGTSGNGREIEGEISLDDEPQPYRPDKTPRVRIEAIGTAVPEDCLPVEAAPSNDDLPAEAEAEDEPDEPDEPDTRKMVARAAENCLADSSHDRAEIDLLMNVGLYRSDFIAEPAVAPMAAGDLEINHGCQPQDEQRTLAFDLLNGSIGFLNACCVAAGAIKADRAKKVMIVAAETEHNAELRPQRMCGLKDAGSAVILDQSPHGETGFGGFLFKDFTEHLELFNSYVSIGGGPARLSFTRSPDLQDRFLECIGQTVPELLASEGLDASRIKLVLPPQISAKFVSRLGEVINVDQARIVDVSCDEGDLFTSSIPWALQHVRQTGIVESGDLGLLIAVSPGIQVGCAVYYF